MIIFISTTAEAMDLRLLKRNRLRKEVFKDHGKMKVRETNQVRSQQEQAL